jgi:hypothetical protein
MSRPPKRLTAKQAVQYFQNLESDDSGDDEELDDSEIDSAHSDDTD